jgi:hypothetical protein
VERRNGRAGALRMEFPNLHSLPRLYPLYMPGILSTQIRQEWDAWRNRHDPLSLVFAHKG